MGERMSCRYIYHHFRLAQTQAGYMLNVKNLPKLHSFIQCVHSMFCEFEPFLGLSIYTGLILPSYHLLNTQIKIIPHDVLAIRCSSNTLELTLGTFFTEHTKLHKRLIFLPPYTRGHVRIWEDFTASQSCPGCIRLDES